MIAIGEPGNLLAPGPIARDPSRSRPGLAASPCGKSRCIVPGLTCGSRMVLSVWAYMWVFHRGLSCTRYGVRLTNHSLSCFRQAREAFLGSVRTPRSQVTIERPVATGKDARAELLARAVRPTVPLRKTFVQAP